MPDMQNLDDYYRGQSSNAWYHEELASLQAEADQRGTSLRQVEDERRSAANDARQAELQRVQALIDDPALLRKLKRFWNSGLTGERGLQNPLDPPLAPNPYASRTGAPSSGRSISPPRQSIPPGWRR